MGRRRNQLIKNLFFVFCFLVDLDTAPRGLRRDTGEGGNRGGTRGVNVGAPSFSLLSLAALRFNVREHAFNIALHAECGKAPFDASAMREYVNRSHSRYVCRVRAWQARTFRILHHRAIALRQRLGQAGEALQAQVLVLRSGAPSIIRKWWPALGRR